MQKFISRLINLRRGKLGTTFISFSKPLKQICMTFPLDIVVEFGPGYSTEIFVHYSTAKILSFETDKKWYKKYKDSFDTKRVNVVYKEPNWDLEEIGHFGQDFSLFFVDGSDRLSALRIAYKLISESGIVFLHDAHREVYEPGIRLFPYYYFPERHSCVLVKDQRVLAELKIALPPDYSCSCQYCSSDTRRNYFRQFVDEDISETTG